MAALYLAADFRMIFAFFPLSSKISPPVNLQNRREHNCTFYFHLCWCRKKEQEKSLKWFLFSTLNRIAVVLLFFPSIFFSGACSLARLRFTHSTVPTTHIHPFLNLMSSQSYQNRVSPTYGSMVEKGLIRDCDPDEELYARDLPMPFKQSNSLEDDPVFVSFRRKRLYALTLIVIPLFVYLFVSSLVAFVLPRAPSFESYVGTAIAGAVGQSLSRSTMKATPRVIIPSTDLHTLSAKKTLRSDSEGERESDSESETVDTDFVPAVAQSLSSFTLSNEYTRASVLSDYYPWQHVIEP